MWSEDGQKSPHKLFSSNNGLEITLECLICVQQGLFLSWDQYLVYFEPLGSLQTQRKFFFDQMSEKPPPRPKTFHLKMFMQFHQDVRKTSKDVCSYSENNMRCVDHFVCNFEDLQMMLKFLDTLQTKIILRERTNIFGRLSNILMKLHEHFQVKFFWSWGGAFLTFGKKIFPLSLKTSQWFKIHQILVPGQEQTLLDTNQTLQSNFNTIA